MSALPLARPLQVRMPRCLLDPALQTLPRADQEGLVAVQIDHAAGLVRAIQRLASGRPDDLPPARWSDYAALHSYERLREAFGELLD